MTDEAPSRGGRTRAEIIEAAHKLFLEKGFHATSMRQIAERAGIALGGIYNHFASKEDIFLVALMQHHPIHDILPALRQAQGESVADFVRDAAYRMVVGWDERQDFLNLMFIELVEFKGEHIAELFNQYFPQTLEAVQRFVAGRDELRPIPIPILLRAFIGLFFSYIMTELLIGKQMPPALQQGALDHFVDIFLFGILKEK